MKESAIERVFDARVRALGGLSFKFAPLHAGNPDRIVLLPNGVVCFAELKAQTGTVDPAQRVWHARAAALGARVYIIRGSDEARTWSP